MAPAARRGRSPGPRDACPGSVTNSVSFIGGMTCNITATLDSSCSATVPNAPGPPAWTAVARRVQAEEVAREAAIRGLTLHIDQAVATLSLRVEEALRSMQDAAIALSEGTNRAAEASRAVGELEQFRESLARLEVACEQRDERVQAVEQRLDDLRADHADGDSRYKALCVRIHDVEEEHRKLDGAIADIAKLGLLAAQVARQTRANNQVSAWTSQESVGEGGQPGTAVPLSPRNTSPASTKQVQPSLSAGPGSGARKSAPASAAFGTGPSLLHDTIAGLQRGNVSSMQVLRAMSPPPVQQGREGMTLSSSSSWSNLGSPQNPPQQMSASGNLGWHRLQWPKASGAASPTLANSSAVTTGTAVSTVSCGSPPPRARRLTPSKETSNGAPDGKSIEGSRSLRGSLSARSEVRTHTGQSNSGNGTLSARRQSAGTGTLSYQC